MNREQEWNSIRQVVYALNNNESKNKLIQALVRGILQETTSKLKEEIKTYKVQTCDCMEEDGLGYHTKDCDMTLVGWNNALNTVLEVIENQSKTN